MSVVNRNGDAAAAAHLTLRQATVSFHVGALERLLGMKLLIYEQHKLRLTTAGAEVYRAAARMLHNADRLVQSVRDRGVATAIGCRWGPAWRSSRATSSSD